MKNILAVNKQLGFSLVEIILSLGIFSLMVVPVLQLLWTSRDAANINRQKTKAVMLANEYIEGLKNIRRAGWDNLVSGRYIITQNQNQNYELINTTNAENIDGFSRYLLISDAFRDNSGKLVDSGGTPDPSTKKLEVNISWGNNHPGHYNSVTYLSRYFDNLAQTWTSEAQFDTGTVSGTNVTDEGGGAVELASGHADWCRPQDYIKNQLTLPKPGNAIVAFAGATIGDNNQIYVGTGDGTAGVTFANISVTNPQSEPRIPVPVIVGTYSNNYKTNGVFGDGSYAYLATDGSSNQVHILRLSDNTRVGGISLPSNTNANGIYVVSNVLYVTSSNKVYSYNITNKSAPALLGTATIWDSGSTAKHIVVTGTNNSGRAYVTMSGSVTGLQSFSVSNGGRNFSSYAIGVISWWQDPKGLAINSNGTRAYIAFSNGGGSITRGFYILDLQRRWLIIYYYRNLGTYDTNGMDPLGMSVSTDYNRAVVVGRGGTYQYQAINITNDQPIFCGGLAIPEGVNAVSTITEADGDVYSYALTGETRDQLKIIEGGSGSRYTASGTYESATLDTNHTAAFNRYFVNVKQVSGTTEIKHRIAVKDAINGSCTGVTFTDLDFFGPSNDPSGYFTGDGAISLDNNNLSYENPGQCFRFRSYLSTTNTDESPVLYDSTVNYSP